jgi:hypothetical protein
VQDLKLTMKEGSLKAVQQAYFVLSLAQATIFRLGFCNCSESLEDSQISKPLRHPQYSYSILSEDE